MYLFGMAQEGLIAVSVYEILINSLPANSLQWKMLLTAFLSTYNKQEPFVQANRVFGIEGASISEVVQVTKIIL